MNIGYIKSRAVLKDDAAYQEKLKEMNVVTLYADKQGEAVALRDMLKYARSGDSIIVEDIRHLSKTAGEFIELAAGLSSRNIPIICKTQKVDTAMAYWIGVFSALQVFTTETALEVGRATRNIEDLDKCFELVDQGKMTVKEACDKLNIGKSTYYRRWRQVVIKEPKKRFPEQFEAMEELVSAGEITVTAACKQMNIGITTYYQMRKRREK